MTPGLLDVVVSLRNYGWEYVGTWDDGHEVFTRTLNGKTYTLTLQEENE